MSRLTAPEGQQVTFVELFFDIVFVFSVTQIVGLLHDGLDWIHVGQAALVFWLVWRGWSQFTWALNIADTTHPFVELGVLFATAVAFMMSVAVPDAFADHALAFATYYVLGRFIGLALFLGVASATKDAAQRRNVALFAFMSMAGLAAVMVGALAGGAGQYALWGLAILLDVLASAVTARRAGWTVHPEHFCERHGLFVIIALGEILILAAAGISGKARTESLLIVALLAVGIAFGLWWSYFARAKPMLDRALESCGGAARSRLARDAYTWAHFPMLCGIIGYAAAVEGALAHPSEPLGLALRAALAACLILFVGGMAFAVWRGTRRFLWPRLIVATAGAIAVVALVGVMPWLSLAVVFATVALVGLVEH